MTDKGFMGHDVRTLKDASGKNYYTCRNCGMDSDSLLKWASTPRCTGKPRS
jgi:hypothetical protein